MREHAVHRLIQYRKANATKPFNARGAKVERCQYCQIATHYCICAYQPDCESEIAALILMSDNEVLKPSNTGRLIADTIKETYCFQWSRTEPDKALLELLQNPEYQPVVIFPQEYVDDKTRLVAEAPVLSRKSNPDQPRPLLIFLDGSWREARRMFRKSPYLDSLPVLSVEPDSLSDYQMRKSEKDNHLSTVEVASLVVEMLGEQPLATTMQRWFAVFRESYLLSKTRMRRDLSRPELQRFEQHQAADN